MKSEVIEMNAEEVKQVVIDIIADIAPDEDLAGLDDDKSLREQLDLDSMDFLDIVMELRKRHKVEVPQEDYPRLATLASCVEYLSPKFQ
jgi:acyl carrier protein